MLEDNVPANDPAPVPTNDPAPAPAETWYKDFGDGYDGLSKFNDSKSLADSYFNLEKMVGKDVMPIPDIKNKDAMGDIYNKLGRPVNSNEYAFAEGSKMEITEDFQKAAHELGLSSEQVSNLGKWYEGFSEKSISDHQTLSEQEMEKHREDLKKEWGSDFERNSNIINRIIEDLPDADLREKVESKFSNDPDFARFMKHISDKAYKEESGFIQGGGADSSSIQDEIDSLSSGSAYLDSKDPLHDSTVKKVRELYVKLENRK